MAATIDIRDPNTGETQTVPAADEKVYLSSGFELDTPEARAARAEAEELLSAAKKANTVATVAERLTTKTGGASGRSIALRTVYVPTLADPVAAARWYWQEARADMTDCLLRLAERDVRLGKREIPGFTITATKVPV